MNYAYERQTFADMTAPVDVQETLERTLKSWQAVTHKENVAATHDAELIEPTERTSGAIVLHPKSGEVDESQSIVLAHPYRNGWYGFPHLRIRSEVTRDFVAPNSRVVVLPSNAVGEQYYDLKQFTELERGQMKRGVMDPFGQQQIRTVEGVQKKYALGELLLTGYSQGGSTVLSMAAQNNDRLNIVRVNADEVPSKSGRTAGETQTDFRKTSDNFIKAAQEAGIPALSAVHRLDRAIYGMGKFVFGSLASYDGRLMKKAMAGHVGSDLSQAANTNEVLTKVGFVEGSDLFDESITRSPGLRAPNLRFVEYHGQGFRKHGSADNVILHALMARDGLIGSRTQEWTWKDQYLA